MGLWEGWGIQDHSQTPSEAPRRRLRAPMVPLTSWEIDLSHSGPAAPQGPAVPGCPFSGPILGSSQAKAGGPGASHTGAVTQVPGSWAAATTFSPLTCWATILGIPHPGPTTTLPGTPGPCCPAQPLHTRSQASFFPLGPTLFLSTPLWITPTQGPVGPHLPQDLSSNS